MRYSCSMKYSTVITQILRSMVTLSRILLDSVVVVLAKPRSGWVQAAHGSPLKV